MVKQPTGTNPRRYPPCRDCGFKDWPTTTWSDQYTYPTDGRCKNCYSARQRRLLGMRPQAEVYASHPAPVARIVTLASRGIRGDVPPVDPALTPRVVWATANLNARKAIGWLVARGMDADRARHLATWQPAAASTANDGERRAA